MWRACKGELVCLYGYSNVCVMRVRAFSCVDMCSVCDVRVRGVWCIRMCSACDERVRAHSSIRVVCVASKLALSRRKLLIRL